MADEKYLNHISKTPCIYCISLIPAGNEPSSRASVDIWRLPRGLDILRSRISNLSAFPVSCFSLSPVAYCSLNWHIFNLKSSKKSSKLRKSCHFTTRHFSPVSAPLSHHRNRCACRYSALLQYQNVP